MVASSVFCTLKVVVLQSLPFPLQIDYASYGSVTKLHQCIIRVLRTCSNDPISKISPERYPAVQAVPEFVRMACRQMLPLLL